VISPWLDLLDLHKNRNDTINTDMSAKHIISTPPSLWSNLKVMKSFIYKITFTSALLIYSISTPAESIKNLMPAWKKKQGFLLLSMPVKLNALIPTEVSNAHTKYILPLIYEPLVTINSKQELQPVLAKSWVVSSDSMSIIITINPKHFFSDGTEVTAQDVVNSIYRVCSHDSETYVRLSGLIGCYEHAKGNNTKPAVKAVSKYQVQFSIASSPTNFLYQLSLPNNVITKKVQDKLIGSGPYLPVEQRENYAVLDKNIHYSGDYTPQNSGIIFFYANRNTLTSSLIQDHADGAIIYRMADINSFKSDNYKLIMSNPNISEILVLNNNRFPFNQSIVRKALASSLYNSFDRSCNSGTRQAYGLIPTGIGGSISVTPPDSLPIITPQEVFKQVPQLMNKRATITIQQLDDIKSECESRQIIAAAKKYNIDLKFKYHKNYSSFLPLVLKHQLDGYIELYVFPSTDANSVLQLFAKKGGNHANINHDIIDKMLTNASMAKSSHTRYQAYNTLTQYIQDEGIVIPLYYMKHGTLLNNCLAGIADDFFYSPFVFLPKIYKKTSCL
jgi:ABC-type transport system substrate-binding protein